MFEKLFGHEKSGINEPEEISPEIKAKVVIDPETGLVSTTKEFKKEMKEKLEDPSRFRDLK